MNVTTDQQLANPAFLATATSDYLNNQTGPLTSIGGDIIGKASNQCHTLAPSSNTLSKGWEKVPQPYRRNLSASALKDLATFSPDWPELELLPLGVSNIPVLDAYDYASFTIAVLTPLSRGNVTINSTDTDANPLISPNWLLSPTDQEVAVQGLKVARDMAAASGITVGPELSPGPDVQSDAQILEAIRASLAPIHHAVGTCKCPKCLRSQE